MIQPIEEQQEFITWLKSEGIYNIHTSTATMQAMHEVWIRMKKSTGMFKLEPMEPVPVAEYSQGKINPFQIDLYSMGHQLSKNMFMMYDFHTDDDWNNAYFINTRTGDRQRIILDK